MPLRKYHMTEENRLKAIQAAAKKIPLSKAVQRRNKELLKSIEKEMAEFRLAFEALNESAGTAVAGCP